MFYSFLIVYHFFIFFYVGSMDFIETSTTPSTIPQWRDGFSDDDHHLHDGYFTSKPPCEYCFFFEEYFLTDCGDF